jgi:branched-chain amino acid transport system substrate-binding protein
MKLFASTLGLALALGAYPAFAQGAIKVGVSMPITGPVAFGGLQERRGLDLALSEINKNGGVLGSQIALLYEDNQCNPSLAVTVTNKLIEEGVPAIIGAQCSSAVLAAMPVLLKSRIPLVSGIASSPSISEQAGVGGNPWVFRLNPSDRELAVADVKYLQSLGGVQKVAIVAESTDYGRGGADAFATAAKINGLTVVSTDYYPLGNPDFTTIITRLRSNGVQAVAVYQAPADNINFAQQALAQGLTARMTGKVNFDGDAVAALIAQGAFTGASTAYPYSPAAETPENKAFVAKIIAANKETSTYETFAGYEELYVLVNAIKKAGSADPAAIRDALSKTRYPSMMGGTISFDDHNQAHNSAVVIAIEGGKVVVKNVFPTN